MGQLRPPNIVLASQLRWRRRRDGHPDLAPLANRQALEVVVIDIAAPVTSTRLGVLAEIRSHECGGAQIQRAV